MSTLVRARLFVAISICAAVLPACGGDYRFETRATYEAPAGRFEVAIRATGVVASGADLSSSAAADVRITAIPTGARPAFETHVTLPGQPATSTISDEVRRLGYEATAAELEEVDRAVEGALRGPKATLMQGQTRALRVVDTSIKYP